ncbi:MAG: M20/M25/M40 family metallo-hydrolase [Bacteroidales bacterium]|nr:M20/M25/M40 family metallo-hydrolase [Bacteroidales bacterium]
MRMDLAWFRQLLEIDSTSGKERTVAEWLEKHLEAPHTERFEVGDGTLNLLLSWGTPQVIFCTHMDTVPPYLPPSFEMSPDAIIRGRGACDAKGQLFALYTACRALAEAGETGFGLLLLAGEETGSYGAKAFAKTGFRAPYLIIGEPTGNQMVSASKGTQSYDLVFTGKAFHSGYPEHGVSAVDLFVRFMEQLQAADFGEDPELGPTTWNVGLLHSDNPQNILSPRLTCRLYFRTTFVSHPAVQEWMASAPDRLAPAMRNPAICPESIPSERPGPDRVALPENGPRQGDPGTGLSVSPRGGDTPARYLTLDGFPAKPVAFGSDAPHLTNFREKAICGPGSITVAHRDDEQVRLADLELAVHQYIAFFHRLNNR